MSDLDKIEPIQADFDVIEQEILHDSHDDVEMVICFDFSKDFDDIKKEYTNNEKNKEKDRDKYNFNFTSLIDIYNKTKEYLIANELEVKEYHGNVNTNHYFLLIAATDKVMCLNMIDLPYLYFEEFLDFIDKYPYHCPDDLKHVKEMIYPSFLSSPWEFTKTALYLPNRYIEKMNNYFGEEISFYFVFIRFYTMWLLMLLLIAIVVYGIGQSTDKNHISSSAFSILVAISSSFFLEFWKKYSNTFQWKWSMDDYTNQEVQSPNFKTNGKPKLGCYHNGEFIDEQFIIKEKLLSFDKTNSKVPEIIKRYFSPLPRLSPNQVFKRKLWTVIGLVVVGISVLIIPMVNISIFSLRIVLKKKISEPLVVSGLGSIINAVSITIFNKIYERISKRLTIKENHRIQSSFTSSYTSKLFIFQFVNSFTGLFYIAFIKNNVSLWGDSYLQDTCADVDTQKKGLWGGCVSDLEFQLFSILLVNLLTGIVLEVILPYITSYVMKKIDKTGPKEKKHPKKDKTPILQSITTRVSAVIGDGKLDDGANIIDIPIEVPKDSKQILDQPWEDQFYMQTYTSFDDYNEIILQYSYISLFIAASPIAILLATANNLIEMKSDLFKIIHIYRRPIYSGSKGIGHWYIFLEVIGFFAVLTNVLLIGFSFPTLLYFSDSPYTILWVVVIIEHIVICLRFLIRFLIKDETHLIRKRRAATDFLKSCILDQNQMNIIDEILQQPVVQTPLEIYENNNNSINSDKKNQ
ncbi:hypothetical protein DLAC_06523 [Tieghemostelium lacteum]|uniref:Anoctamin transmembrane domain-containing protein n=1 Tax=Tieghemostelium lacteum TaxID=361077 RepID=A0A151ZEZ2_TIELA|nr:hypothetical protein DLAC_06523 [Tieghemostelium lacteum]|eukprot:KYQ92531.1 hypothetical protein DLAC_06523 [Tieghemostelium lacteum]